MREYTILDVFTDAPLAGNPVAVFADGTGLAGELMQRLARELNLSETVFVLPAGGDADARARIFTPAAELPFAGHPVLGTAFLLGRQRGLDLVRLEVEAGIIPVTLRREAGAVAYGEMEQLVPEAEPFEPVAELLSALGLARSALPVEVYRNGPAHVYVALASPAEVAALKPDISALEHLGDFCFNCFAGEGSQFKTRMFSPVLGVVEDPATGSAAGPLAIHLARHGWIEPGREIEIQQGVEIGRPSLLRARAEGRPDAIEHVFVGGSAVEVAHGRYFVPGTE